MGLTHYCEKCGRIIPLSDNLTYCDVCNTDAAAITIINIEKGITGAITSKVAKIGITDNV